MAQFNASFTQAQELNFKASLKDETNLNMGFGGVQVVETGDYAKLANKPQIEGNVLIGDKTFIELGLGEITPQEIDEIIYGG